MRVPCALFCAHVLHFTLTDNILNVILTHCEILPQQGYSWEFLVGGLPPGSPNPDPKKSIPVFSLAFRQKLYLLII